jgi:hypothetical protein
MDYLPRRAEGSRLGSGDATGGLGGDRKRGPGPKFEGESTYKQDYFGRSMQPGDKAVSQKPQHSVLSGKLEQTESNYKETYRGHAIPKK